MNSIEMRCQNPAQGRQRALMHNSFNIITMQNTHTHTATLITEKQFNWQRIRAEMAKRALKIKFWNSNIFAWYEFADGTLRHPQYLAKTTMVNDGKWKIDHDYFGKNKENEARTQSTMSMWWNMIDAEIYWLFSCYWT